ncbi:MAG: GNAT family N-acetyltransferase [Anaerolineales bacterium]|nr:GNAT family N-acetyltransferase [Anaerolineales bacterium]
MEELLTDGYQLRPVRWNDAEKVLTLIDTTCKADGDPHGAGVNLEEFNNEWKSPGFNPETDAWVVTAANGDIVGYEELNNRSGYSALIGDGYVHPEHLNNGIGTAMLRKLECRAREVMALAAPDLRVYLHNGMGIKEKGARELHTAEGFQAVRFFWHMEIRLESAPPEPELPQGLAIRPLREEWDEFTLYKTLEEAFIDHWGHVPRSFKQWSHRTFNSPTYDPSLYFLAWEDEEPAAGLICTHRGDKLAWIATLGVRRPWRKRGLGLALLQHAFSEFYRRGDIHIGLGVDAANPTGATRLYEKAGMQVAREYVVYEKVLRPGRELEEME